MKIIDTIKKFSNVLNNEKNYAIFLLMLLINSVLIEGGSLMTTLPWILIMTFILKFKYKSSKVIIFHTLFTLTVVGVLSEKFGYAAMLFISEVINLYAGLMLYKVTMNFFDKGINKIKKSIQIIFGVVMIAIALLVNMSQFGFTIDYLKSQKVLKKYVEENYNDMLKGSTYFDYYSSSYYMEIQDIGTRERYRIYNKNKIIEDEYIGTMNKNCKNDLLSTLVVLINNDEKLEDLKKEDVKISFNEDITNNSYDSAINLNISLKTKYENIVEFNNYAYTLLMKLKEIDLNYNEVIITSLVDEADGKCYKVQIANSVFPDSLTELEKISYIYAEDESIEYKE